MSAIEAASVKVTTMADGTLRVTFDVEPRFAQQAFALFGAPGSPSVLARLVIGAQPEPEPEKPKGGPLAKSAGVICGTPLFQQFARVMGYEKSADGAASLVRESCGVQSRAEIDGDEMARAAFAVLMSSYRAWAAQQPNPETV